MAGGDNTGRVGGGSNGGDVGPPSSLEVGVKVDSGGKAERRQEPQELPQEETREEKGDGGGEGERDKAELLPSSSAEENDGNGGEARPEHQSSKAGGVVAVGGKSSRKVAEGGAFTGNASAAADKINKKKRKREKGKHAQRGDGEARASPQDTGARSTDGDHGRACVPSAKGLDSTSVAADQLPVKKKSKKKNSREARGVAAKDGAASDARSAASGVEKVASAALAGKGVGGGGKVKRRGTDKEAWSVSEGSAVGDLVGKTQKKGKPKRNKSSRAS